MICQVIEQLSSNLNKMTIYVSEERYRYNSIKNSGISEYKSYLESFQLSIAFFDGTESELRLLDNIVRVCG